MLKNRKDIEIRSLLEVTEAINKNLSEDALYRIFYFTCISMFKIDCMALIVLDESNRASCKGQHNIKIQTEHLKSVENYQSDGKGLFFNKKENRLPHLEEIELILAVHHEKKRLAYVLLGGVDGVESQEDLEDLSFIQTMANIIMVAIENKRLVSRELKRSAFRKEMEIAQNVQSLLVPKLLPNNERINLCSSYLPHSMVSGDYYDYIELNDDEILFCIADVSGKGIPAALLMSNFQASLRTLAQQKAKLHLSLQDVVHELNAQVFGSANGEKFITFFIAHINLKEKTLEYINAGHNHPILLDSTMLKHLNIGTIMLGAFQKLPFLKSEVIELTQNMLLFAYTDGIIETNNNIDEPFGEDRLDSFLKDNFTSSLQDIHQDLIVYLDEYKQNQPYFDDLTLFSFRLRE